MPTLCQRHAKSAVIYLICKAFQTWTDGDHLPQERQKTSLQQQHGRFRLEITTSINEVNCSFRTKSVSDSEALQSASMEVITSRTTILSHTRSAQPHMEHRT